MAAVLSRTNLATFLEDSGTPAFYTAAGAKMRAATATRMHVGMTTTKPVAALPEDDTLGTAERNGR